MVKFCYHLIGRIIYCSSIIYSKLTATTKPRSRVILQTTDNQVFLVKNWIGLGNWQLPGGRLNKQESPRQAAIREIKEELGLELSDARLQLLTPKDQPAPVTIYHYQLTNQPTINCNPKEIMTGQWFQKQQLVNLNLVESSRQALRLKKLL